MHKYNIRQHRHSIYKQSCQVPLHVIIHPCLALFLSSSSAWFIVPHISSWFSLRCINVYTSATLDSSWFSYTSATLDSSWFSLHRPLYWSVNQTYAWVTVIHSSSSVILTCKPELRPIFSLFATTLAHSVFVLSKSSFVNILPDNLTHSYISLDTFLHYATTYYHYCESGWDARWTSSS